MGSSRSSSSSPPRWGLSSMAADGRLGSIVVLRRERGCGPFEGFLELLCHIGQDRGIGGCPLGRCSHHCAPARREAPGRSWRRNRGWRHGRRGDRRWGGRRRRRRARLEHRRHVARAGLRPDRGGSGGPRILEPLGAAATAGDRRLEKRVRARRASGTAGPRAGRYGSSSVVSSVGARMKVPSCAASWVSMDGRRVSTCGRVGSKAGSKRSAPCSKAGRRNASAGDAHDIGLDHHVVEAADQEQMLDIVPPQQNQLRAGGRDRRCRRRQGAADVRASDPGRSS